MLKNKTYVNIKHYTNRILKENNSWVLSRIFEIFIISLIFLNMLAVILETVNSLVVQYGYAFHCFEIFSIIVFTIEYILRLWTCTFEPKYRWSIRGRIRYIFTPMMLLDLIVILPFYIPMIISLDLRFLRALRLIRVFRIFKMARYFEALQILGDVIKSKKEELIITIFMIFVLLILASSFMFFIENRGQPEVFSSIPQAMWWGTVTLTTVGYGDIYPKTPLGKFTGAIVSLLGIGMFALPTGIIAAGFTEEVQKRRNNKSKSCPHCGKQTDT